MSHRLVVLIACFLLTGAFLARAERPELVAPRLPLRDLPLSLGDWNGREEKPFERQILDVLGVDEYITRTYQQGATTVGLYVGFYQSQRQGDTIHSPLNCLPGAGWIPVEQSRTQLRVTSHGAPRMVEVNHVVIQKGLDRRLVLYWYQSHGRVIASEYWGKVYTVADAIRLNRTDAALVRIVAPLPDGGQIAAADASSLAFLQSLFPVLEAHLPS
jgi:EpsI family protein